MRTRIKICGLRTEEALDACAQAGVDAVGFVFYPPSPRHVSVEKAAQLVRRLPAWVTPVALFVNPDPADVNAVIKACPAITLQFHGDEAAEFCESFGQPWIKAVRFKPDTPLKEISQQYNNAGAILVDSWSEGYGGSGHSFDWSLLPRSDALARPLVLSGGLDADNVAQAISRVRPYAVDVSSGVESARGVKDIGKIFRFCEAIRGADTLSAST